MKTVLIAGAPAYDRHYREPAILLNKTYSAAITAGGALPLIALGNAALAAEYAAVADALLLTGTASFAPVAGLLPKLKAEEEPVRDEFDRAVYFAFKAANKPILGICLGLQMINVFEGGTLKRNFKLRGGQNAGEHMITTHPVITVPLSVLWALFGPEFDVNSRHNDRIDILADTLVGTAFSPDGVIEAVEHREKPIYGVQWHPERQRGDNPEPASRGSNMTPLFEWFVKQI